MRRNTVWPSLVLDRSSRAPTLRQQIARQLESAIYNAELPHDCRLPSSRLMATVLNVSRGTVVDAYATLLTTGVLVAIAGSGIRVAYSSPGIANADNLKKIAIEAHYPERVYHFDDWDGSSLYFMVPRL